MQGLSEDTVAGKSIRAEVPLKEMFGYATDLRSLTQGRATFTMEFSASIRRCRPAFADAIVNRFQ